MSHDIDWDFFSYAASYHMLTKLQAVVNIFGLILHLYLAHVHVFEFTSNKKMTTTNV